MAGIRTVLSVDGGGVRGIIPGVVLECLESQLQMIDGDDVRLADYFDVIAGTSTGAIIASMLTVPSEHCRPLYKAKDIKDFYMDNAPIIFPSKSCSLLKMMTGPKYDGNVLNEVLMEGLACTRIRDTLTNVVIPTYDIMLQQPTIFSTYEARVNDVDHDKNLRLYDICIGSTAAPTYFPAHEVLSGDMAFNLIDGGIAANNPTLVALNCLIKEDLREGINGDLQPSMVKILSLGTGKTRVKKAYSARKVSKWGVLDWIYQLKGRSSPIIDCYTQAGPDMVDIHASVLYRTCQENYLRIQCDDLSGTEGSMDNSKKKNLNKLVEKGRTLLSRRMKKINISTGDYENVDNDERTNEEALLDFAIELSSVRKMRSLDNGDVNGFFY